MPHGVEVREAHGGTRLHDQQLRSELPVALADLGLGVAGLDPGFLQGHGQGQELTDEAGRARKAYRGHGEDHEGEGIGRHPVDQSAIARDLA